MVQHLDEDWRLHSPDLQFGESASRSIQADLAASQSSQQLLLPGSMQKSQLAQISHDAGMCMLELGAGPPPPPPPSRHCSCTGLCKLCSLCKEPLDSGACLLA